jgi:hypothetical protein
MRAALRIADISYNGTYGSFRLIHLVHIDAVTEVAESGFLLEYRSDLPQGAVDGVSFPIL